MEYFFRTGQQGALREEFHPLDPVLIIIMINDGHRPTLSRSHNGVFLVQDGILQQLTTDKNHGRRIGKRKERIVNDARLLFIFPDPHAF